MKVCYQFRFPLFKERHVELHMGKKVRYIKEVIVDGR
jgi:hypothetical protein